MLVEQMQNITICNRDNDLIIEALKSNSGLKIMCACLALQKQTTFDSFFLEHTQKAKSPKKNTRIRSGRLSDSKGKQNDVRLEGNKINDSDQDQPLAYPPNEYKSKRE